MTKYCIKITLIVFLAFFLFPQAVYAAFFDGLICGEKQVLQLSGFLYLFVQIAQWILGITGSLALLMFVIGGFIWLVSRGQQKWIEMGRATLINAVIGLLIVFGSWFLIDLVLKTVAPGVYKGGRWYEFSNDICKDARTKGLAQPAVAPPSTSPPPPQTRAQQQLVEARKNINCQSRDQAEKECELKKKEGKVAKIVTIDGSGKACEPAGSARCEVITKGLACDARYERASTTEHGCICKSTEVPTDILATSQQKTVDGVQYLCCQCAGKAAVLVDAQCGQSGATFKDFNTNKRTRCCEFKKGTRPLKQLCGTGQPMPLKIRGKEGCYCVSGNSICNVTTGEGCRGSLDPGWRWECKTEADAAYEGADSGGKAVAAIVNTPGKLWSWIAENTTATNQTGICIAIKN